jgi:tetratricopeptide (TPR) repeat protein
MVEWACLSNEAIHIFHKILDMKNLLFTVVVLYAMISCSRPFDKSHTSTKTINSDASLLNYNAFRSEDTNSIYSKEAIELNRQATLLIISQHQDAYFEAIQMLDKAIMIDTTYYLAYANKASVWLVLKEYSNAVDVLSHLVTDIKKDYCEGYTLLGLIHEKLGDYTTAVSYYWQAVHCYEEKNQKKQDLVNQIQRAHLLHILKQPEGLMVMDSLIRCNMNNEELEMFKEIYFINYNHKDQLDDL